MRKLLLCLLCLVVLSGCSSVRNSDSLPQGITLLERQLPQPGQVVIPYSKYKLSNGLTVILSPDHSDPLVHVDVTYHVGSAREMPGKTGFAHFFEHMMFQGSKHVGDQQHFKLITEAGGSLNGTTNRDRTNYYDTVPSNQLEKVLWLESDRMGFLLDAVSQRKFEIQRDTVKNERAQNYDNRPYGLMWEKMGEAMFPQQHPYSWQSIGYVKDLDNVDVNDLKAFFLRWYGPNNAVLTIGGDIDVRQTLDWVKKYFGPIPKGHDVGEPKKRPVTLSADRYVTMEDRIQQPMVVIGWPTQYMGAESKMTFDVLAQILGNGSNSLLYQSLVKPQKALSAGAFQNCGELACTFYVYAMTSSKKKNELQQLSQELLQVIGRLERNGIEQSRLDEIKGMAKADAVFALESVRGKVAQLASNQTFYGEPDRLQQELGELEGVSSASIQRVLQKYIISHHKVTLSVVPRGEDHLAVRPANFVAPEHVSAPLHHIDDKELQYREVTDSFDRTVIPSVSGPVTPRIPKLYSAYYENGIELMGTVTSETPTVLVNINLPAGKRFVPQGKEGLAELTISLLSEGSQLHSAEEIQSELDKLGSVISFDTETYSASITVSSLSKNLRKTLAILDEMLFQPKFAIPDFKRIQNQMIQGTVYQHQKLDWLASQATRQVLFGNSLFARVSDGTEKSLAGITLDDVKTFYRQHYTPHGTQIAVVGDISKQEAIKSIGLLSGWKGDDAPLLAPQIVPEPQGQRIYLIDKPGALQSIVRYVRQGLPFDATGEFFLSQLANFNLAGNFNSRMNQNLREDKGYTYGTSSTLAGNREIGVIVFSASVRKGATVGAIQEMQNEMTRFSQQGMTSEEMRFMRLAVGQQDALVYETPSQKSQLLSGIMTYSLEHDYLQQRNRIVATVGRDVLNQLAKKWFNPKDYQIIVVGDMKTLKPKLEKLKLPMEELEIIH
ncbi:M16 family metallopeptidase [Vibrio mangrovi]|uniref:Peptidase M16 inactive domain protein n=1 Tax=Vibrio mangrovi TaxID=474394 RepID=A0A1Y6IT41_9VIBR|nr:pitrilysin family protein [Vibrio mangrovi]MDW6001773.1 pitrilysin family protein [Vibrio mangrovi]SMS00201.1 Peptidase M16 inactive domain protein [Vibrio mangrovi]